jgi:hypothetical protein
MKYRRHNLKKVGIILIALALFIAGSAMAAPGIEATKQISFIGANGAGITSTEMSSVSGYSLAFSNMVTTGSSFTMNVVNARTQTNNRFVEGSDDTTSSVNHNIRLTAVGNTPSVGKVSAFIEGITQESRGTSNLFAQFEFSERTSVDGQIMLFDKDMHWESGTRRV